MDFPAWAPQTLVAECKELLQEQEAFAAEQFTLDELEQYAQKNYFPTWKDLHDFLIARNSCLERLLTDGNARSIWEWVGSDGRVIELLWATIARTLETWYQQPRMTRDEFRNQCEEIADLAKDLAGKLALHQGDVRMGFLSYPLLVPQQYRARALKFIHPKCFELAKKKSYRSPENYIGAGLPPIHVLLNSLSQLAKSATYGSAPTKIRAKSALRKMLLPQIVGNLYGNGVEHSTSNLAALLGLILKDDDINDATIRGDLKGQEWWEFYSAKDFPEK